ncbi:ATP-binding protein [Dactylosporangium sp. NPDC006015]|uniref:ATP-binding protein n=1 Tax=Dactylosporangium sp. NPDC006015 TaxID=3154576 RepID=UPI0033B5735F
MTGDALRGFRFHRLLEVPGRAGDEEFRAAVDGSHAALAGHPDAAVMAVWTRPPADRRLRLLLAGRPLFPPAVDGGVLFPPGAVAEPFDAGAATALLDAFPHWVVCEGRFDPLWGGEEGRGAFDSFVGHLSEPFAFLVVAGPLTAAAVEPELDGLVTDIVVLDRPQLSEAGRRTLERKQARHRELTRAQLGGAWRVKVLVAGAVPRQAAVTAAMLCAAAQLDGLPYRLIPGDQARPLRDALAAGGWFTAGAPLLTALLRPPRRELPGLRLVTPHTFDVTPEQPPGEGVRLGAVLDRARHPCDELWLPFGALNRHTLVCGTTGAGKSHTVRHLLRQATRRGLPWLVLEPAKAEYARLGGAVVIRPNDPDAPPAGLNPLEPAPGFPLQTHVELLRALFLAAFAAHEPFPQVLAAALHRCYEELGWDLTLGAPAHPGQRPRYPTLGDLQRVAEAVVRDVGYGREISDNVRGFIAVRLASLRLGSVGRFFDGGHPIDVGRLLSHDVVLELEDVGDDTDKAFLMGAVVMRLVEHLRVAPAGRGLRHLTVVEEAHRLLRRPGADTPGPAAHAVELFAALLAEVRAYGEGIVVVEQIPGKLVPDVVKNTAVKVVHRLAAADDRDLVGAAMNLDEEQSRHLLTLAPGEAAVFPDGADHALLVRVPGGTDAEDANRSAAGIGAVIGRRSATCGAACLRSACTLRHMRTAQQLLAAEPWLALWAELAVLAHLAGHPTPVPRPDLREALAGREVGARVLDCAISHAVDDAVAVRSSVLQPSVSPDALATHVCAALRAPGGHRCGDAALTFLARPYRWERVRHALTLSGPDGPDPRTARWQRELHRIIPGTTRAEQLAAVTGWLAEEHRDRPRRDLVTFGARRPSTVELTVGGVPDAGDWPERVGTALTQFDGCTWPTIHLLNPAQRRSTS